MSFKRVNVDESKIKRFIRESRVFLGLDLVKFAKVCGVSYGVMEQIENDSSFEIGSATALQILHSLELQGIHRGSRFFLLAEESRNFKKEP